MSNCTPLKTNSSLMTSLSSALIKTFLFVDFDFFSSYVFFLFSVKFKLNFKKRLKLILSKRLFHWQSVSLRSEGSQIVFNLEVFVPNFKLQIFRYVVLIFYYEIFHFWSSHAITSKDQFRSSLFVSWIKFHSTDLHPQPTFLLRRIGLARNESFLKFIGQFCRTSVDHLLNVVHDF